MVEIVIKNVRSKIVGNLPPEAVKQLDQSLSYLTEGYFFTQKHTRGHWDGRTRLFDKRYQTFDTGCFYTVKQILDVHGIPFKIDERRDRPTPGKTYLPNKDPRDYQEEAIEAALKTKRGVLLMATGAGKSYIISSIVGRVNLPTMIYVHTKDLLYQMKENIEYFLGVQCGQIGGGVVDIRRWNVAMMQTVCKALKKKYEKYDDEDQDDDTMLGAAEQKLIKLAVAEANVFMVDECHHVSASSYQTITRASKKAYYRLGFTATLREDGADLLIHGATGRTLYQISASELIRRGWLVAPTIYFINVPKPTAMSAYMGNYQAIYKNNIVENEARNDLVAKAAGKLMDREMNTLILVKQIVHGKTLYHKTKKLGKTVFVQGAMDGEIRKDILHAFKNHQIDILIATSLADEGLDLPNLDSVILAGSGKSSVKAFQRIGRALRPYPGKRKAVIYDFNDNVKYLNKHSKRRLALYKQEPEFNIKIQNGK